MTGTEDFQVAGTQSLNIKIKTIHRRSWSILMISASRQGQKYSTCETAKKWAITPLVEGKRWAMGNTPVIGRGLGHSEISPLTVVGTTSTKMFPSSRGMTTQFASCLQFWWARLDSQREYKEVHQLSPYPKALQRISQKGIFGDTAGCPPSPNQHLDS